MKKQDVQDFFTVLGCGTLVFGFIASLIFYPVIVFGCAYLGGLILKWIVGETLTGGLNLIFNTTRFTPNLIPLACATLATIGRYFRSASTNNTSKSKS